MVESPELDAVLRALCEDLELAVATPSHAREILDAMRRLVATFPAARRGLGRLLWQSPAVVQHALYDPGSAAATLRLLAALALDSPLNQRRIARHLAGVWLSQRPDTRRPEELFVLTLPSALRVQYQQWNRRRRELSGRRLPSGAAPQRDGVPAPCLCDDCLGADQLLATWLQHFRDLSKWAATADEKDERSPPRLSAREFLATVLCDSHELRRDVAGVQDDDAPVYYFVPKSQSQSHRIADTSMDPLQHVCAIALQRDESSVSGLGGCRRTSAREEAGDAPFEALERVELWAVEMEIAHCNGHDDTALAQEIPPETHPTEDPIVACILSFLEPTVELPGELWDVVRRRPCRHSESRRHEPLVTSNCTVRFVADLTQQQIEIECHPRERPGAAFEAAVARSDLLPTSPADDALALLLLDHETLRQLELRLCDHDDSEHAGVRRNVCLRRRLTETPARHEPVEKEPQETAVRQPRASQRGPMPGLDDASTRLLQALDQELARESELSASQVIETLVRAIRQCDARMTTLARAAPLSEAARSAARERCRGCRDLLVRASKRIRLCEGRSADARAIARKAVARVLQLSASIEPWERPDERVERLHLSRSAWCSGVPDAEFFVASAASARERKRVQQRLNRQLREQRHASA
ncbi:hypothetical protein P43SY_003614 [Pythium insidiosum]|uniref:Uncharacterized protein n=1 Tax=Pythium insidiosum TaxID=114742 RepID=A0AAD5QD62_PYTIN|nr:hypothetical protein P43SY_003614 [Pythium insidiosum]